MASTDTSIETLRQLLASAEAVVVGGASGLSASAGFRYYYQDDDVYRQLAGGLRQKYGKNNVFDLFYCPSLTRGEYWALVIRQTAYVHNCYTGTAYQYLAQLLDGKNFYIVTTNQDAQFYRTFAPERITRLQGDWRYWQCSRRCHDAIYWNQNLADELLPHIANDALPDNLIPRCPHCGAEMDAWVRSRHFLEGEYYEAERERYLNFLRANANKRILFLELGVGMMTPMFIKEPFMNMAYQMPRASYVTINPKHAIIPPEIAHKSLAISLDITTVLAQLLGKDTSGINASTDFNPSRIY